MTASVLKVDETDINLYAELLFRSVGYLMKLHKLQDVLSVSRKVRMTVYGGNKERLRMTMQRPLSRYHS
jgi:hypothetical protein